MAEELFVVYAIEQPHKGYLCGAKTVQNWYRAIKEMGNTPEIMKIVVTTLEVKDPTGPSSFN